MFQPSATPQIHARLTVLFQGIHTLCQYAFENSDVETAQEALRCIANALLLEPRMRQVVVDLGFAPKAADRLKACPLAT